MKKSLIGIGSNIIIVRGGTNYFCKVYKIEKPKFGGMKFDFIVVDEAEQVKDFKLPKNWGKIKINGKLKGF
jgi:hypothetical protein